MSKLHPTKLSNQCPICSDTSGKCRQGDRIILCMNNATGQDSVAGYRYIKSTKNGLWGEYVEDTNQPAYSVVERDNRRVERAKQALELQLERANSLSIAERDRAYRDLLNQLVLDECDRQNLLNRGLTNEQIKTIGYKSVQKWQKLTNRLNPRLAGVHSSGDSLTVSGDGYLIPIANPDGLIIGLKLRLRDAIKGNRYLWLKSSESITAHLPSGELPIGVYRPETVTISNRVGIAEGEIKPQISAIALGQNFIGASGGNFTGSPEQLKQALTQLDKEHYDHYASDSSANLEPLEVVIYPDAGSHGNQGVMNRLKETFDFIKNLGYAVKFAYWNQLYKATNDIDELSDHSIIEYFDKWVEFEALGLYQLRKPDLVVNERFLSPFALSDRFGIGVKSDKGTGKTEIQKHLTKIAHENYDQPLPVLYITTHTSLVKQASDRLGVVNHYELEECKSDEQLRALILDAQHFGIAITYDSLHKLDNLVPEFTPFYIYLDEAESSTEYLLSSGTDLKNRRTETITQLTKILRGSKAQYPDAHLFMFDEALTNISADYFLGMIGQTVDDAYIIRNDYRVAKGRIAYEYGSRDTWLDAYSSTSDRTICYTISQQEKSKTSAQNLAELTGDTLAIDAHTTTDPDHRAFKILQSNPGPIMRKYQRTVHTSTMGVGFSIDEPNLFDSKWVIAHGLMGSSTLLQGVDRYRSNIDLHYFVPEHTVIGRTGTGSCNWQTLAKQAVKNTNQHIKELQEPDIESESLNNSLKTWAKFEARQNLELAKYRPMLRLKLRAEGYEINKPSQVVSSGTGDRLKEIAEINYSEHCENIENSDISDEAELCTIKNKKFLTKPERHKLKKQELSDRYLIPVTSELVEANDDGLHSKLRRRYYLTTGREYLSERDKAVLKTLQGDDGLLFSPDASKSLLSATIALLEKIKVTEFIESVGSDKLLNDDRRVVAFNQILISDFYRYPLKRLIGVTINPESKPLINIKKLLQGLGYGIGRDERAIANHKSSGIQILPTSDLHKQILDAWLDRDIQKLEAKLIEVQSEVIENKDTVIHDKCRKIPNDLYIENSRQKFPMQIPDSDQFPMVNSKPVKNKSVGLPPMRSPNQIIPKLRKGMEVLLNGSKWVVNILGTVSVTLKTLTGDFEKWCSDDDISRIEMII